MAISAQKPVFAHSTRWDDAGCDLQRPSEQDCPPLTHTHTLSLTSRCCCHKALSYFASAHPPLFLFTAEDQPTLALRGDCFLDLSVLIEKPKSQRQALFFEVFRDFPPSSSLTHHSLGFPLSLLRYRTVTLPDSSFSVARPTKIFVDESQFPLDACFCASALAQTSWARHMPVVSSTHSTPHPTDQRQPGCFRISRTTSPWRL